MWAFPHAIISILVLSAMQIHVESPGFIEFCGQRLSLSVTLRAEEFLDRI